MTMNTLVIQPAIASSQVACHVDEHLHNCSSPNLNSTLVVIDANVENYAMLADAVLDDVQIVILERDRDGIEQLTQVLLNHNGVNQVHIVAHGTPGCLYLGNSELSWLTLEKYEMHLLSWFLTPQSNPCSLFIYGCNVASGAIGSAFIQGLQELTRASVAASTTPIGSREQGGNWELDAVAAEGDRPIAPPPFNPAALSSYSGILATYTVDITADEDDGNTSAGDLSLREAIRLANASTENDTIVFGGPTFTDNIPDTITLTNTTSTGILRIGNSLNNTGSLTITGSEAALLTVNSGNAARAFDIGQNQTAILEGFTVTSLSGSQGAAIYNSPQTNVTLRNMVVSNTQSNQGAIYNGDNANLTIVNTTFSNNQALQGSGGAIYNSRGIVTVIDSTFANNQSGIGGAVYNAQGTFNIIGSTFSNNQANNGFYLGGGAIVNEQGTMAIANSTLSGNRADASGGGIYNSYGNLTVSNSTITRNTADANNDGRGSGGGIINVGGTATLQNAIIAGNGLGTGTGNITYTDIWAWYGSNGTSNQVGNTIVGGVAYEPFFGNYTGNSPTDLSGSFTGSSNLIGGDPKLAPLANNGGPTQTHAPLTESPVINAGDNSLIPSGITTDQRGATRISGGRVDIGAVESAPLNLAPTSISLSNSSIAENQPANTSIGTLTTTDPDNGDTHTYRLVSGSGDTDNSLFAINGNVLRATQSFDYETRSSYSVRIQTRDSVGNTFDQVFAIAITDVNEAPANQNPTGITLSANNIPENQSANVTVGTFTTIDPNTSDAHTYTLVVGAGDTDNSLFAIEGNVLRATQPFNFETRSAYSIRVQTSDNNGGTFEKAFTVNVLNVNEAPQNIIPTDQTVNADTPLVFSTANDNRISITDVDITAADAKIKLLAVTLTAGNGNLTLSSTNGLTFTSGANGTANFTVRGTLNNINTLLEGLSFNPTTGYKGNTRIQIITNDLGNSGIGVPLTDTDLININVNSVDNSLSGLGGQKLFTVERGQTVTIANFGGVGSGSTPSPATIAEADTIQFSGADLIARRMLLTQTGSDLEITFAGVNDTKVVLQNFALENLDNFTRASGEATVTLGNIQFNRQTTTTNSFDVIDANATMTEVLRRNTVTFLNDFDNHVEGLDNSADTINGQGGSDWLEGWSGRDWLRGDDGDDFLGGGVGDDTLTGGSGGDQFLFNTDGRFYRMGVDRITDFNSSEGDLIILEGETFNTLSAGRLDPNEFAVINASTNRSAGRLAAKLIYNEGTGGLIYNPNGTEFGWGGGGTFATLVGSPTLTAGNINVGGVVS